MTFRKKEIVKPWTYSVIRNRWAIRLKLRTWESEMFMAPLETMLKNVPKTKRP